MYEIGQKPLPLRSRPFFGSHHPQRIRRVRQRIRREPRARARASSTRARGSRASRPGRRSPTRSTSSTGSPIQASRSRSLDHEQRPTDRGSRIKEMPSRHRARPTKQGTRASTAHDARDQDRESRITYSEHRSRARGSWSRSQAQPGRQIAQANGARAWRSSTSSYPGTLARIYQARTRATRPTAQASPGEIPPGKKKGLRRALSWSPGDVLED